MLSLFRKSGPPPASVAPGEGDFFSIFAEGEGFSARQDAQALAYRSADPFPHIMIDGVFRPQVLRDVLAEVPSPLTSGNLFSKDVAHLQENKFAWRDVTRLGPKSLRLINYLYAKPFLEYLTAVTGIEGLVPDPYLWGAGFHQILRGGKLAVHADFNIHPQMNLYRRLNVLVYLNEGWDPAWHGNLELWTPQMDRCAKSITPDFNRMVIFSTTDTSYHGHPDPLDCPPDVVRRSLALYYYTYERLHEQVHSTLWQRRPHDADAVAEAAEAHRLEHG
ncbi:2OG-Fe(II) oxygenase [Brevundimonas sp. R86498]|uniref:2OG-Fe(II) oxygenase n=1 Tax=Brevundimonas sp. R86498 TaxID=3093845 RepID=UPI0037C5BE2B